MVCCLSALYRRTINTVFFKVLCIAHIRIFKEQSRLFDWETEHIHPDLISDVKKYVLPWKDTLKCCCKCTVRNTPLYIDKVVGVFIASFRAAVELLSVNWSFPDPAVSSRLLRTMGATHGSGKCQTYLVSCFYIYSEWKLVQTHEMRIYSSSMCVACSGRLCWSRGKLTCLISLWARLIYTFIST
jgi:hypothetical protein